MACLKHTCGYNDCAPCHMDGYEQTEIDFVLNYIAKLSKQGEMHARFLDIGAHVGLWSMQLQSYYNRVLGTIPEIYAVEPSYTNYRQLTRNAELAQGIVPIHAAAWDCVEPVFIVTNENPGRIRVDTKTPNRLMVPGITLDAVPKENRKIDGVKIDVEGAELKVLQGMKEILLDNKNMVAVIEYSIDHFKSYGYGPEKITAFMKDLEFRPVRQIDKRIIENIKPGDINRVIFVKGNIE